MNIKYPALEELNLYIKGIDYRLKIMNFIQQSITTLGYEAKENILSAVYWSSKIEELLDSDCWKDLYKPCKLYFTYTYDLCENKLNINLVIKDMLSDNIYEYTYVVGE